MKFEWDEAKNQANIRKRGVDFRDAVYVFADPFALNLPDDEHSENEERWLLLGANLQEKIILVVHTYRYNEVIGIISARVATNDEKKTYFSRLTKWKTNTIFPMPNKASFMFTSKTSKFRSI